MAPISASPPWARAHRASPSTCCRAKHTHNVCLRHILLRERSHDALDVRPLLANQVIVGFSPRLDEAVRVVSRVLESDQTIVFLGRVPMARGELVPNTRNSQTADDVEQLRVGTGIAAHPL